MRFAQISDQVVVNVIIWDGESSYPHEGELINIDSMPAVGIGWGYVDGEFIPPDIEDDEQDGLMFERQSIPSIDDLQQQIADLQQRIDALETKKK